MPLNGGMHTVNKSEPVFVNVYGAQESIPINRFRQLMKPSGPVRQIGWESIPGYAVLVEKVGHFLEKVGLFWKKPYFFQIVKF